MKKIAQYLILFFAIVSCTMTMAQSPAENFKIGNDHYTDGQYQEAIDSYKKVLATDQESAALYFNLANTYYKLNQIAPSIYYYEKAQILAPADQDIRNNAAFAQKMKIDAITPLPENIFEKWHNSLLQLLTTDGWAYTTLVFTFLLVIFFVGYYFSSQTGTKRPLFVGFCIATICAGLSLTLAYNAFAKAEKDNPAIVFAAETQVKSEPNLSSTDAFVLHEGTKVFILDTVKNWQRIKIADGKIGWIQASDIKEL